MASLCISQLSFIVLHSSCLPCELCLFFSSSPLSSSVPVALAPYATKCPRVEYNNPLALHARALFAPHFLSALLALLPTTAKAMVTVKAKEIMATEETRKAKAMETTDKETMATAKETVDLAKRGRSGRKALTIMATQGSSRDRS